MLPNRIHREAVRERIGPSVDPVPYEERTRPYQDLIGFVPPRIEARLNVTGALDPQMVQLQEAVRAHGMVPRSFDVKTAQLMLFGMLLMDGNDACVLHGIAARRAGASWHEMQDTVNLVFLFRGLSAANRGAEVLAHIAQREAQEGATA